MDNNFSNIFGFGDPLDNIYMSFLSDIFQSKTELQDEIDKYANGLVNTPPVVEVPELFKFFQTEKFSVPHNIEFNSLTEEQKTLVSMIDVSERFITFMMINREMHIRQSLITSYPNKNKYTGESNDIDIFLNSLNYSVEEVVSFFLPNEPLLSNEPCKPDILYSTPPLRKVFVYLTQIKHSFHFFLEWFFGLLGPLKDIPFDYEDYNYLLEAVAEDNYELFRIVVRDWNEKIVKQLSYLVELSYPIFKYIESQTSEFEQILDSIKKDITTISKYRKPKISSPIRLIVSLLIIYIIRNNVDQYVGIIQQSSRIIFLSKTNTFKKYFFSWIDNEVEAISDHYLLLSENCSLKSSVNNDLTDVQPPLIPKQKKERPDFIKVPCGQLMLEKLVNGLVNGYNDETLGGFPPLVSSKKGENNESIKKKLICLFSGEGINDESIKWPYDLKWNDHANSLKLLVYLLHFTGKLPDNDPFKVINEKDSEGISDVIRTNFRGKKVWPIVGTALGYDENTLRNKVKIPKESNISLMKKLAQFWFDCKILGD